jgi:hypothetical protein
MPSQAQKPIWWKIIVGMLLIFVEVRNHVHPSANLLKANNQAEQTGMYVTMVAPELNQYGERLSGPD